MVHTIEKIDYKKEIKEIKVIPHITAYCLQNSIGYIHKNASGRISKANTKLS